MAGLNAQTIDLQRVSPVVASLKTAFGTNITRSYKWRLEQLNNLKTMITNHTDEFVQAVQKDLGKKVLKFNDFSLICQRLLLK